MTPSHAAPGRATRRALVVAAGALVLQPSGAETPPRHITLPTSGVYELGRDAACELVLAAPTVSHRHAVLRVVTGAAQACALAPAPPPPGRSLSRQLSSPPETTRAQSARPAGCS
jgi:hypothetical protein